MSLTYCGGSVQETFSGTCLPVQHGSSATMCTGTCGLAQGLVSSQKQAWP